MEQKKFTLINRIFAVIVLLTAAITYLMTIEPTVSFWDCGEFIASSYKLEVGHAPGNPVFQMIARFFTMFASPEHAAMAVNIMSALCSAFTIFFLYLTIVHLGRRIIEKNGGNGTLSMGEGISLIGAGVVGALAYCWSDTFWFSAVEAEVYAMSSLFTAAVFWMILKWEEQADTEYADRFHRSTSAQPAYDTRNCIRLLLQESYESHHLGLRRSIRRIGSHTCRCTLGHHSISA